MRYWKAAAMGVAIAVVTAVTTGVVVSRWSEVVREVPVAAMPAAVLELPPRTVAVSDGSAEPQPRTAVAVPKSVTRACDAEAMRAAGVTLATKKKMREVREGATYRTAFASCLKASGYTS